jgi:hypothetical protein
MLQQGAPLARSETDTEPLGRCSIEPTFGKEAPTNDRVAAAELLDEEVRRSLQCLH